jgi:anaerobic selenocysteine-containing dehydrogenase
MTRPPRSWGKSTVQTSCPLDCPDSCTLDVSVENGRIVTIDGGNRNPTTAGFICAKVRGFAGRVYGPSRVQWPAVRSGAKGAGSLRRVSWDEALTTVAERLTAIRERWGGEAILPYFYGGSNGFVTQGSVDADFFHALGASRLARTLCAAATGAAADALYGKMPGVAYQDYAEARLIVIWGANPTVSGMHLVPYVREAQRRGARLVVVDPRRTQLAKLADLHVALRPGTDLPAALSIHRYLFEHGLAADGFLAAHALGAERLRERAAEWDFERAALVCGVAAADLERLAAWYASSSPALIRCGWGLERNRNGASAVMAVLALPAVAGKFGIRGGGYTMSNSAAWNVNAAAWRRVPEPATRVVNMNHLGRALLEYRDPPVQALFVYNCNPAVTVPDQNRVLEGLQREDLFTVVFDQVMTDTATYADVVLPATTFLETYDVARGYGAYSLQLVKPVIDAMGESRPNVEVFGDLMRRMGLGDGEAESEAEVLMRVAGCLPQGAGDAIFGDEGVPSPEGGSRPVQFEDVFPRTPGRKIHLFREDLDRAAPAGLYGFQPDPATVPFPLALISPASDKTISSTLGELRQSLAHVYLHPDDAVPRGIETGDHVRIISERGEVHCFATVGDGIAPGTVSLPKGLWRRSTFNQATATALSPDTLTDLGGGACFNDARVEIQKMVEAQFGDRNLDVWVDVAHGRSAPSAALPAQPSTPPGAAWGALHSLDRGNDA